MMSEGIRLGARSAGLRMTLLEVKSYQLSDNPNTDYKAELMKVLGGGFRAWIDDL